jgi:hypothetical protein
MQRFIRRFADRIRQLTQGRSSAPAARQFRPGVEGMEDRLVPSAMPLLRSPVLNAAVFGQAHRPLFQFNPLRHLFMPKITQVGGFKLNPHWIRFLRQQRLVLGVPNLAGVRFNLKSDNPTVMNHELDIFAQTYNANGSATFTGQWSPLGEPANAKPTENGLMQWDSQGVHITFTWANGTHTFDGHITVVNGNWHLDGQTNAGPGHVVGDAF